MNYIQPHSRQQVTFGSIEEQIEPENTVRFLDAFAEQLDLAQLGNTIAIDSTKVHAHNSNPLGTTPEYVVTRFVYNEEEDTYTCPVKQLCISRAKGGREIERSEFAAVVEQNAQRYKTIRSYTASDRKSTNTSSAPSNASGGTILYQPQGIRKSKWRTQLNLLSI